MKGERFWRIHVDWESPTDEMEQSSRTSPHPTCTECHPIWCQWLPSAHLPSADLQIWWKDWGCGMRTSNYWATNIFAFADRTLSYHIQSEYPAIQFRSWQGDFEEQLELKELESPCCEMQFVVRIIATWWWIGYHCASPKLGIPWGGVLINFWLTGGMGHVAHLLCHYEEVTMNSAFDTGMNCVLMEYGSPLSHHNYVVCRYVTS